MAESMPSVLDLEPKHAMVGGIPIEFYAAGVPRQIQYPPELQPLAQLIQLIANMLTAQDALVREVLELRGRLGVDDPAVELEPDPFVELDVEALHGGPSNGG